MPCRHARNGREESNGDDRSDGLDRRSFLQSALLIGGGSAMATAANVVGFTGTDAAGETIGTPERDNRQHAWSDYLTTDDRGVTTPPQFHVVLFLEYQHDGEPTAADRAEMEGALQQLEGAFDWSDEGLLFTVNYGQPYFERFDESLPDGAALLDNGASAEAMIKRDEGFDVDESPVLEPYDLFVNLASNTVTNVLAAEEALWGNLDDLQGVEIEHTFEGLFTKPTEFPDRRTGFVGRGVVADNTEQTRQHEDFGNPNERIDERADSDAFLTMGFQSNFPGNQTTEDDVSLVHDQRFAPGQPVRSPGAFAQGTIQHASHLSIDVETWYDDNLTARRTRMFSPEHDLEETGRTGEELGTDTDTAELPMRDGDAAEDVARGTRDVALELRDVLEEEGDEGVEAAVDEGTNVGHSQKLARARMDPGTRRLSGEPTGTRVPLLARRDFNTLDGTDEFVPNKSDIPEDRQSIPPNSALHFLALMRFNEDVVVTRRAMNEIEFTAPDGSIDHAAVPEIEDVLDPHGIHEYIVATRRGNFLMPPLTLRSLPPATATEVGARIEMADGDLPPGTVDATGGTVRVTIVDDAVADLDPEAAQHVRFGPIEAVNRAHGAAPTAVSEDGSGGDGSLVLEFDAAEAGFDPDDYAAKLLWIDGTGEPIQSTQFVRTVERDPGDGTQDGSGGDPSSSLVINDYDDDSAWPGENDLGDWNGAGGFENGGGSGEIVDDTLALQYDGAGWFVERVERDVSDYDELVLVVRGENGGEGDHVSVQFGSVRGTLSDLATGTVGTDRSELRVDVTDAGADQASPAEFRLNFWDAESGASTLYVEEVRLV